MPNTEIITDIDPKEEKKKLAEEKKQLKVEQKEQKKEAKKRAKEISLQEAQLDDEDEESGGVSVFFVTTFIVIIWIAILCLLIKLDIGGFGSGVLAPILQDVPVINKILPATNQIETDGETAGEEYGGYTSLKEAVDYIKQLELELQQAQSKGATDSEEVANLKAEVERLKTFENSQVEFQNVKNQFYEDVIYSDKAPSIEEYMKYYEGMDPATAEYIYKQAVSQKEESDEVKEYAKAYSDMKPKEAAAIFEAMTDKLDLVARILSIMTAEERGDILGVMKPDVAAKVTKIMDPES